MKNEKRILSFLLACLLLATLPSCSGKTKGTSEPNTPPISSAPTEPAPPASTVTFSKKPSIAVYAGAELGQFINLSTYMSIYVEQLYMDKEVTVNGYATSGEIANIKSSVNTNGSDKVDLALVLLNDKDAELFAAGQQERNGIEKYQENMAFIVQKLSKNATHTIIVGPYTTSADETLRASLAAYQQVVEQACKDVASVQYFACQTWVDQWASDATFTAKGTNVLSETSQKKLAAEIIQATHMTSLNQRAKSADIKNFSSDFVIAFAGDSITDAGRDRTVAKDMYLGNGFVSYFDAYMKAEYADNAPSVLNTGTSGATSKAMMGTFQNDVDSNNPNYLVVMIGINDAYVDWSSASSSKHEEYKNTLKRMMENYAKSYDKVVLMTPFYLEKPELTDTNRAKYVNFYGNAVKELAAKYKNTVFVDIQAVLDAKLDQIGYSKMSVISPDKVHLTIEGCKLVMKEIIKALQV